MLRFGKIETDWQPQTRTKILEQHIARHLGAEGSTLKYFVG